MKCKLRDHAHKIIKKATLETTSKGKNKLKSSSLKLFTFRRRAIAHLPFNQKLTFVCINKHVKNGRHSKKHSQVYFELYASTKQKRCSTSFSKIVDIPYLVPRNKRLQRVKDSRDKLKYDKTFVDISTTNNIDEVHSFCKLKLDRIINESRCFPDQK